MPIEYITAHEADQRIRLKQSLWSERAIGSAFDASIEPWQAPTAPEAAHAATAEGADDDEISKFGAFNALPAVAMFLVALAAFVALLFAAVGQQ